MADFRVDYRDYSNSKLSSVASSEFSGEGSRYAIENGVLTVYDGKGKRLHFSPSGWVCVQDAEQEQPSL